MNELQEIAHNRTWGSMQTIGLIWLAYQIASQNNTITPDFNNVMALALMLNVAYYVLFVLVIPSIIQHYFGE